MRRIFNLFTFLFVLLFSCNPKLLPVKLRSQPNHYYCWATSLRMVVNHYKKADFEECAIVRQINKIYGIKDMDCCGETPKEPVKGGIHKVFCQRGGGITDVMIALEYIFKIDYQYRGRALEFNEIVDNISLGRMILVGRSYAGGSGHLHPILGVNPYKRTVIIGEVTGGLLTEIPYDKFVGSLSQGIWTDTFIITAGSPRYQKCSLFLGDIICVD